MRHTVALFSHRLARPLEQLTGIGRYSVELTRALVARDTSDHVLVAPWDEEPARGTWPAVPVVRVGGGRRVLQARWTVLDRPALDVLVPGIDLVHSLAPTVHVPTRGPAVVTVHDLFPFDRPEWLPRRGRWLFRRSIERLAAGDQRVITPSQHVAGQVVARAGVAPDRIHVVPEGVEPRFHAAHADPSTLARYGVEAGGYLLALGTCSTRKNVVTVVRALGALPPVDRPVLLVAGPDGDGGAALADAVTAAGLDDHVRRVGFVPDDDVPALVAGARALVQPSLDEGFGLPAAEALAAGTPVLASDRGALPEVVGGAGWLLDPTDVDAWASTIAELAVTDPETLATAARRRGAAFTWEAAAAATEAVHHVALGAHPSVTAP